MLPRTLFSLRNGRRIRPLIQRPKHRFYAIETAQQSQPQPQPQPEPQTQPKGSSNFSLLIALGVAGAAAYAYYRYSNGNSTVEDKKTKNVDFKAVRKDISDILDSNPKYDDGSYAPILVRLAWHASGTYDSIGKDGGSNGATMRFDPESGHGGNKGLDVARNLLEPLKKKYPDLSYGDLWILGGCVAIEHMGGPRIEFRHGRKDKADGKTCTPDGRLPDATKGASHIREVFSRQGFTDQETVALIGAHCIGRCHLDRSGYDGIWTNSPTTFTNDFFVQLLDRKWTKKKNKAGVEQYYDETGTLMMLPADYALLDDREYKKWVDIYAKDEDKFFKDFAKAFQKLIENGTADLKVCPVDHARK